MTRALKGTGAGTRRRKNGSWGRGRGRKTGRGWHRLRPGVLGLSRRRPGVSELVAARCLEVGGGTVSCGYWRPGVLQ